MAVNVKMGVDVTQFKQGMQQAQQSAKTLNAQLKANESQFKATGDREQYLTEKSKLLKQQFEAQKTAAANAEKALDAMRKNGVEKTSAEYQKMEQALANAQAAMFDAQSAMNGLTESSDKAGKSAGELANSLSSINKKVSFDAVISGIDRITGGLEKAAGKVIDIGQGIWDEMMKSAQWADDTATLALMYEVPLKDLLEIQALVAGGLDTTVDAILGAQVKVRRGVGNGSIADDLAEIGVSMEKVVGVGKYGPVTQLKDSVSLFWEAGEAIMNLGNEYDKESAAQAIFGKGWRELFPLFDKYKSQEEFAAAMDATNTNTEEEVNKLAELNDAVGELKHNFEVLENKVLAGLAPALTRASEVLSGLLDRVMEYLDSPEGQQALKDMETAVSGLFEELGNIDPEQVVEGFAGVFNSIVEGLQWLDKNKELLAGILVTIVTGWAAAKITGGALQVLQLVNGLTSLGKTPTVKMPKIDGNGNGGGNGVSGNQTVTSQTVTNQTVTTQNVTTGTVTNETVTNMSVPNLTATSETITTSNVTTMNVANLNGYPSNPTNPSLPPTTDPTGYLNPPITVPYLPTSYTPLLNDGSGGMPSTPYLGPGDDGVYLTPPGGGSDLIRLDPSDYSIDDSTSVGFLGMLAYKIGKAASTMNAVDPAGASALLIPWLEDNTTFGKTFKQTGNIGAAASAVGSDFASAPGKAVQNWKSWSDQIFQVVLGKTVDELTKDVTNALTNAAADSAIWMLNAGPGIGDFAGKAWNAAINWIPVLMHGKNGQGDYDQNYNWREFFNNEVTVAAVSAGVEMFKTLDDAKQTLADIQEYLDGIAGKKREVTIEVNMLPAGGVPSGGGHGSWGGAGAGAMGQMGFGLNMWGGFVGMHANGLFSVPWDGYPAILHKGERVMTAEENKRYTYNNYFGNVNLNNGLEIEALTESIERRNRRQQSGFGA